MYRGLERVRKYKAKYDPLVIFFRAKKLHSLTINKFTAEVYLSADLDEWLDDKFLEYNLLQGQRLLAYMKAQKYRGLWAVATEAEKAAMFDDWVAEGLPEALWPEMVDYVEGLKDWELEFTEGFNSTDPAISENWDIETIEAEGSVTVTVGKDGGQFVEGDASGEIKVEGTAAGSNRGKARIDHKTFSEPELRAVFYTRYDNVGSGGVTFMRVRHTGYTTEYEGLEVRPDVENDWVKWRATFWNESGHKWGRLEKFIAGEWVAQGADTDFGEGTAGNGTLEFSGEASGTNYFTHHAWFDAVECYKARGA